MGQETHVWNQSSIYECPELRCVREQWPHSNFSEGPQTMQAFMWQDDAIDVAKFINACSTKIGRWKAH